MHFSEPMPSSPAVHSVISSNGYADPAQPGSMAPGYALSSAHNTVLRGDAAGGPFPGGDSPSGDFPGGPSDGNLPGADSFPSSPSDGDGGPSGGDSPFSFNASPISDDDDDSKERGRNVKIPDFDPDENYLAPPAGHTLAMARYTAVCEKLFPDDPMSPQNYYSHFDRSEDELAKCTSTFEQLDQSYLIGSFNDDYGEEAKGCRKLFRRRKERKECVSTFKSYDEHWQFCMTSMRQTELTDSIDSILRCESLWSVLPP